MKNTKCTECGATAVKEEDFALFDYNYDPQTSRRENVEFAGIIRMALCNDCIEKRFKGQNVYYSGSWSKVMIMVLLTIIISIAVTIFIGDKQGAQAGGVCLVIFGGMTITAINSTIKDKEINKEREEKYLKYRKAKEKNNLDMSLTELIGSRPKKRMKLRL